MITIQGQDIPINPPLSKAITHVLRHHLDDASDIPLPRKDVQAYVHREIRPAPPPPQERFVPIAQIVRHIHRNDIAQREAEAADGNEEYRSLLFAFLQAKVYSDRDASDITSMNIEDYI